MTTAKFGNMLFIIIWTHEVREMQKLEKLTLELRRFQLHVIPHY